MKSFSAILCLFFTVIVVLPACAAPSATGIMSDAIIKGGIQMDIRAFGAKGDGITDDTLAWRRAIAAAPEGATIKGVPGHTYYIALQNDNRCLEITKAITLDFNGAQVTYKPWSNSDPAGTHSPAIWIHGSQGTSHAISAATTRGTTVTLTNIANAASYAAGDWIMVTTTASKNAWNNPAGIYNTFGSATEPQQIKSVNAGTGVITLTRRLDNFYPASASIRKLTLLRAPAVRNISRAVEVDADATSTKALAGDVGHFISIEYSHSPIVENVRVENFRMFCVWSQGNINPVVRRVTGHKGDGGKYISTGGHAYVVRHQACLGSLTENCTSYNARHLLDYTMSYDGISRNNTAHLGVGAFLTHGFGSRRITSVDDAAFDSSGGWAYQNVAFDADYEGKIIRFKYVGSGYGIEVGTNSQDVEIINPDITIVSSSNSKGILVSSGAKDVTISGGTIDTSGSTSTTSYGIAVTAETPAYPGIGISSASATAGTNPTVTINTDVNHNLQVGDQIYVPLNEIASGQYHGTFAVASVPTTTQLTYVVTGTTTESFSIGSSPSRKVWRPANYHPAENVYIKGVTFRTSATQSHVIEIAALGTWVVQDCKAYLSNSTEGSNFLFSNNMTVNADSNNIIIKNNHMWGAISQFAQLERSATQLLEINGNVCEEYTAYFFNAAIPTYLGNTWKSKLRLLNNAAAATAPTGGISTLNLWDAVKEGALVQGNTYPANAAVTNAYNKNYEYGSFTPTIEGATTAGTASYSTQIGRYSLDGKALNVRLRLNYSSFTGTGTMRILGIPYSNGSAVVPGAPAEVNGLAFTGIFMPQWSSNYIVLRQNNGGTIQDVPVDAAGDLTIAATLPLTSVQ